MRKMLNILLLLVLGLTLLSGISFAGPFMGKHPMQSDRFTIAFGGYMPDVSGDVSIDDIDDPNDGTDIDINDDLGIDESDTLPAGGLVWRLSNTTRIQGEYFSMDQDGNEGISRDINIGDIEFEVGARLDSELEMAIARVFYGYSFIKNDSAELGAGVGLHYMDLDFSTKGKVYINDITLIEAEESIDDWAILPNIGGYASYAFSPRWLVGGRVDWISANIGDYDGTLWNAEAFVQFQMFDHFGLGLAYRYLDFELSRENDEKRDWEVGLDYSGPVLFFTANF